MSKVHVVKSCVCAVPTERYIRNFAVSVFGDYALGACPVNIFAFVVVSVSVKEQNHIGVLLDRAGITQVGKLRAVVAAFLFLRRTGKL